MVKITLEFDTPEAAVVALGKLIGGRAARAASKAGATEGPVGSALIAPAAPQAPAPASTRKPRSDAGQPRGPYKKASDSQPGAAQEAKGEGAGAQSGDPVASAAAPTAATSPAASAPEAPAAAAPASTEPTQEDAQAALEALFAHVGGNIETTRQVLGQFKVAKLRDLAPADRAGFIAAAQKVVATTPKVEPKAKA